MQENVNAINIHNQLISYFGEDNVKTLSDGGIKLKVYQLANQDLLNISNLLMLADIQVRRSDKKIVVIFIPR